MWVNMDEDNDNIDNEKFEAKSKVADAGDSDGDDDSHGDDDSDEDGDSVDASDNSEDDVVGDDANGDDADGNDAQGDDADGNDAQGDDADGDYADGNDAQGDDADGDYADGNDAQGDDADGNDAQGDDADGDYADGKDAQGDDADANDAQGDAADGDDADGDYADGDYADGDDDDGDYADGDYADGDDDDGDNAEADGNEGDDSLRSDVSDVEIINNKENSSEEENSGTSSDSSTPRRKIMDIVQLQHFLKTTLLTRREMDSSEQDSKEDDYEKSDPHSVGGRMSADWHSMSYEHSKEDDSEVSEGDDSEVSEGDDSEVSGGATFSDESEEIHEYEYLTTLPLQRENIFNAENLFLFGYTDILADALYEHGMKTCTLKFINKWKRKPFSRKTIKCPDWTCLARCKYNKCKRFLFKFFDIFCESHTQTIECMVYQTNEIVTHKEMSEIHRRNIKGVNRVKFADSISKVGPFKADIENWKNLYLEPEEYGNLTKCPNVGTMKKIAAEKHKSEQLHEDDFIAIQMLNYDLKKLDQVSEVYTGPCRRLTNRPFRVVYATEQQLQIYNSLLEDQNLVIHCDATGSLLRKLTNMPDHPVYLYTLTVRGKSMSVPLVHFLSNAHDSDVISEFLTNTSSYASTLSGGKRSNPTVFNIDNSRALINAALRSYNNENVTQYLNSCADVMYGNKSFNNQKTVVHLCTAHYFHQISRNAKTRATKPAKDKIMLTFSKCAGTANATEQEELLSDLFTLLSQKTLENSVVEAAYSIDSIDFEKKTSIPKLGGEQGERNLNNEMNDGDERKPIKENSFFYKHYSQKFNCLAANFKTNLNLPKNPYYSPDFVKYMLNHSIPYLSLWTPFYQHSTAKLEGDELYTLTTATAESYFNVVKNTLFGGKKNNDPILVMKTLNEAALARARKFEFDRNRNLGTHPRKKDPNRFRSHTKIQNRKLLQKGKIIISEDEVEKSDSEITLKQFGNIKEEWKPSEDKETWKKTQRATPKTKTFFNFKRNNTKLRNKGKCQTKGNLYFNKSSTSSTPLNDSAVFNKEHEANFFKTPISSTPLNNDAGFNKEHKTKSFPTPASSTPLNNSAVFNKEHEANFFTTPISSTPLNNDAGFNKEHKTKSFPTPASSPPLNNDAGFHRGRKTNSFHTPASSTPLNNFASHRPVSLTPRGYPRKQRMKLPKFFSNNQKTLNEQFINLGPGKCMDDDHVYCGILHSLNTHKESKVGTYDTVLFPSNDEVYFEYAINYFHRHSSYDNDNLMVPIHIQEGVGHWVLVDVNLNEKNIYLYDSLPLNAYRNSEFANKLNNLLISVHESASCEFELKDYKLYNVTDTPKQLCSSMDCGISVVKNCEHILKGEALLPSDLLTQARFELGDKLKLNTHYDKECRGNPDKIYLEEKTKKAMDKARENKDHNWEPINVTYNDVVNRDKRVYTKEDWIICNLKDKCSKQKSNETKEQAFCVVCRNWYHYTCERRNPKEETLYYKCNACLHKL